MNLVISNVEAGPFLDGDCIVSLKSSKLLFPTSNICSVLGAHARCTSLSVSWSKAAIRMEVFLLGVFLLMGHFL
jgi:hypothetical protein